MKVYADKRSNAISKLKIGDNVLVEQPKQNKLSAPFNPKPLQITNKKGPMVLREGKTKQSHETHRFSNQFEDRYLYRRLPMKTMF